MTLANERLTPPSPDMDVYWRHAVCDKRKDPCSLNVSITPLRCIRDPFSFSLKYSMMFNRFQTPTHYHQTSHIVLSQTAHNPSFPPKSHYSLFAKDQTLLSGT
jgi:hypothetical protein